MSEARQVENQAFNNSNPVANAVKAEALLTPASNAAWFVATRAGLSKTEKSLTPFAIEDGSKKPASGRDSVQPTESHALAPVPKGAERGGEEFMPACKPEAMTAYNKAVEGLPKGAVKDFYKELGAQLESGKIDTKKLADLGSAAAKQMRDLAEGDEAQQAEYAKLKGFSKSVGLDVSFNRDGVKISQAKGDFEFNASATINKDGEVTGESVHRRGFAGPVVKPIIKEEAFKEIRQSVIEKK